MAPQVFLIIGNEDYSPPYRSPYRSHCICLPSYSYPLQGDPKICQCNSFTILTTPDWPGMPWFCPSAAHYGDPTPTNSINRTFQAVLQPDVFNYQQHLNLHVWCLGVDNSKNKVSFLCGGGRENCYPSKVINMYHL